MTQPSISHNLKEATRVIKLEIDGLTKLLHALDQDFVLLVENILRIEGRVILSGMGKSGHIAHKMAATLASTGTPAFFVHPGEASHGDLGMITPNDFVILLSNSGKTSELSDLIAYTRRFKIPLCGVTFGEKSILKSRSDYPICLPQASEACPLGLAPTTSTTMMMAFGDALAISLLKARGFTSQDFKSLHPGGSLGKYLLKVEDLMDVQHNIPLVYDNADAATVLIEMTQKSHGCTGVLDQNDLLIGIITDGDLRRYMSLNFMQKQAKDLMSPHPITVIKDILAVEALRIMNAKKITKVFVVSEKKAHKKPVGILNIHKCLERGLDG